MRAIALTDHGVLHGAVKFYSEAMAHGIKPLIGCEVYVAAHGLDAKRQRGSEATYHLTLLAENQEGYRNLCVLSSLGFLKGFYYRPRIDRELLAQHRQGLVVLSGCMAAEVPSLLAAGDYDGAKRAAAWYLETFGRDHYFLELMDHGLEEQRAINEGLLRLHQELGVAVVATNDVHYLRPEDASTQDVLICVQTGKRLDDPDRLRFTTDRLYLKTPAEMEKTFGHIAGALANTVAIAERCAVDLGGGGYRLPRFGVDDPDLFLREKVYEGARDRYGEPLPKPVVERLERELAVIAQMGFADYFLIVWDLVQYARSQAIAVGPGRGSSASSLVAYVLKITDVDPLQHGLVFERFLNPERVTMPDIDIDFCYQRRGEVLEYAIRRFGEDRVAQIGAFGTLAARGAVRDVGRVLGMPYGEVDRIAKLIPAGPGVSLREAIDANPQLGRAWNESDVTQRLLEASLRVEGTPRHLTVHAAGIVISPEPLMDSVPVCTTSDGTVVTQYPAEDLEELGYLKMDLLGLRTLTVIDKALALIQRRRGEKLDLDGVSLDDPKVYAALSRGDAAGVFQLETGMFRELLKEVRPREFSDLVAILALGRPGPMIHLHEYLARRRGEREAQYLHPAMQEILAETYGIMLYQEQVMQIASALAGYTPGQADLLRRAMGKKLPEIMQAERDRFVKAAVENGLTADKAERVFADIAQFAEYGFAKSHSVAYALLAYKTAYLKVHFPVEFMAAQMSTVASASERLGRYLQECRQAGIIVRGPDINQSDVEFDVDGQGIRFGLASIKHVGRALAQEIVRRRGDRPFASLEDFCRRMAGPYLNRKALESLVRAGAFDSLGSRGALLARIDAALRHAQGERGLGEGQMALFVDAVISSPQDDADGELSLEERLADELELLGACLSTDPLKPYREIAALYPAPAGESDGTEQTVVGVVVGTRVTEARRGGRMAFLTLEDAYGRSVEVILFPSIYAKLKGAGVGKVLAVYGKVEADEELLKVVAQAARPMEAGPFEITVSQEAALLPVREALRAHPGDTPVILQVVGERAVGRLVVHPRLWVDASDGLRDALNRVEGVSLTMNLPEGACRRSCESK